MPRFGERLRRSPPANGQPPPEPEAQQVTSTASERLAALLGEASEINRTLEAHRAERERLLREETGSFAAVRELGSEDDELKLRLEQIELKLPDLQAEIEAERAAAWEAAWQSHVPGLREAEAELADAITAFRAALERANARHARAASFGDRLHAFVRPPPLQIFNDWSLVEFLRAVDRRQHGTVAQPSMLDLVLEAPMHVPLWRPRFIPRQVQMDEVEQISPLAEPRRVRILHGPVRTANLNFGIARMFEGEEHNVPARGAYALVASGIATYVDEPAIAPAA
jgi:hypothetical protein